ncbi:hypothetical protein J2X68_000797 [Streptomyces sp. 3330]|uniref:DUF6480 family protein n=1 Tax=Streptomyces sp. 3330 TaxID=2817755 RepID=UPI00285B3B5A|nr:DUF6480 family protein [Streptomyces sp. 3330]MDR6974119.1 hypothetical protein [Streptomyces sp. 3330]
MTQSPRPEPHRGAERMPAPQELVPPTETPPVEGSVAEAHQERADGGIWEHPGVWLALIALGALLVAGFFAARIAGL